MWRHVLAWRVVENIVRKKLLYYILLYYIIYYILLLYYIHHVVFYCVFYYRKYCQEILLYLLLCNFLRAVYTALCYIVSCEYMSYSFVYFITYYILYDILHYIIFITHTRYCLLSIIFFLLLCSRRLPYANLGAVEASSSPPAILFSPSLLCRHLGRPELRLPFSCLLLDCYINQSDRESAATYHPSCFI